MCRKETRVTARWWKKCDGFEACPTELRNAILYVVNCFRFHLSGFILHLILKHNLLKCFCFCKTEQSQNCATLIQTCYHLVYLELVQHVQFGEGSVRQLTLHRLIQYTLCHKTFKWRTTSCIIVSYRSPMAKSVKSITVCV